MEGTSSNRTAVSVHERRKCWLRLIWLLLITVAWSVRGDQRVILAWDPNSEPDLDGYILYYGDASRHYTNSIVVSRDETQCAVSSLQEDTVYYFAVTAFNTSQLESDFSNEVVYRAPGPLGGWRAQYFNQDQLADSNSERLVWGDMADPDMDGRCNLIEYALDLDPMDPTDQSLGVELIPLNLGKSMLFSLAINRRLDDHSLTYLPEISVDGEFWISDPSRLYQLFSFPITPQHEKVYYLDLMMMSPSVPLFIDLRSSLATHGRLRKSLPRTVAAEGE